MSAPPPGNAPAAGTAPRPAALRIAALRWEPYVLPLTRPFATARGLLRERRGYLLRVQDAEGAWGVGEAAPLPEQGGEEPAACEAALEGWVKALPGRTVALDEPPLRGPPLELPPAFGFVADPSVGSAPCALHALEQALLHLAARRAGVSVARWLHPRAADSVLVNATLSATDPPAAAAAARHAVAGGFGTLKVKVGVGGAAADERRLRAVREAVGPSVRLRADANGAWHHEEALELLHILAPLELEYVEQPLARDDWEGLLWLAARSPVPLAVDEAIRGVADAEWLLRYGAAAVLVLKPMLLGGPLTALRVARRALAAGVQVVVTTVLEGAYGRLAALHTAAVLHALHREAGLPGAPLACGLATGGLLARDLLPRPPAPEGGSWALPAGIGLGLT